MDKLSCLNVRLGESGSLWAKHGLFSLLSKEKHRGSGVVEEKSRRLPLRVDLGELDTEEDMAVDQTQREKIVFQM